MKANWLKFFVFFVALGVMTVSCDDLNLDSIDEFDEQTMVDNAKSEGADGDVFGIVNGYTGADGDVFGKSTTAGFPTATWVGNVLTVDYGTEGCTDPKLNDGVIRKGKVVITLTGVYTEVGASVSVAFEAYTAAGNTLTGTRTYTRTATNVLTEAFQNNALTFADGRSMTWSGGGTLEVIDLTLKTFKLNRTIEGTSAEGTAFTRTSLDLVKKAGCEWFDSGKITITEMDNILSITFKTGECGMVTVNYNGIEMERDLND